MLRKRVSYNPEYAQSFVDAGVAVLAFDYLGESEGEPRQHINPWEQIYGIVNAVNCVSGRKDVDRSVSACGESATRAAMFSPSPL